MIKASNWIVRAGACAALWLTLGSGATAMPLDAPNIIVSASAESIVDSGATVTLDVRLGNSGSLASSTPLRVLVQLPSGVMAYSVSGQANASPNCSPMNQPGVLLSCSVNSPTPLQPGTANGAARFFVLTQAPAAAGAITYFLAVDPSGGFNPPAPSANCVPLASCATVTTSVRTPANLTMSVTADTDVDNGGLINYSLKLGNSGQSPFVAVGQQRVIILSPPGVRLASASAGANVSGLNCSPLNSVGAQVFCSFSLPSLPAGAANGAASFTLLGISSGQSGAQTIYAAIDPTGGFNTPAPGPSCAPVASCASATTQVRTAATLNLALTAESEVDNAAAITYVVKLGNGGQSPFVGFGQTRVLLLLPAGARAISASAGSNVTSLNCSPFGSAGAALSCTFSLAQLPAGSANGAAMFSVFGFVGNTGGTQTAYAAVDPAGSNTTTPAPGPSCVPLTSCASATTQVHSPATITLALTADAEIDNTAAMSYTVKLGNSGQSPFFAFSQTRLIIRLPAAVRVSATSAVVGMSSLSCLPTNTAGATLDCLFNLSSLPAGVANGAASFTLIASAVGGISGTQTTYAAVDPTGAMTAPAPGPACVPLTSCASATTLVHTPPTLTLGMSAPAGVAGNASFVTTLGIGNSGQSPFVPTGSIPVLSRLPAGVVATAVTPGAGVSSVNCGSLPSAPGAILTCAVFATISLPAGAANGAIAFSITATAPDAHDILTNYASVSPTGAAPFPAPGPACTPLSSCASATIQFGQVSNFSLAVQGNATVPVGGTLSYTLGLGNGSFSASATTATVADALPAGVVATAVSPGPGVSAVNCGPLPSAPGATLSCAVSLTAPLGAGTQPGTARFTITATAPTHSGGIVNYAAVDPSGGATPATPGSGCLPLASCASAGTYVIGNALLTLSMVGTSTATIGGSLSYSVGLGNRGKSDSGTQLRVADALPAGVIATGVTPAAGVASVDCGALPSAPGAMLSCAVSLSAPLPAGSNDGSALFTLAATAPATPGAIVNFASIDPSGGTLPPTPGTGCAPLASCDSVASQIAPPTVDVTLSLSDGVAFARIGDTLHYTLTVANPASTVTATASVSDVLPGALSGGYWTCAPAGGASCEGGVGSALFDTATLPPGSQAVYVFTALVARDAGEPIINFASANVLGGVTDTNTANNTMTDIDQIAIFRSGFDE